jgi:hypothetical protein
MNPARYAFRELGVTGTACATAKNAAACHAAVDAIAPGVGGLVFGDLTGPPAAPGSQPPKPVTFVITAGDTVKSIATKEDLLAFLGTIDSEEEAVLRVLAENKSTPCADYPPMLGGVRTVGDAFEVLAMGPNAGPVGIPSMGCGGSFPRYVYRVGSDGSLTEIAKDSYAAPACPCDGP